MFRFVNFVQFNTFMLKSRDVHFLIGTRFTPKYLIYIFLEFIQYYIFYFKDCYKELLSRMFFVDICFAFYSIIGV